MLSRLRVECFTAKAYSPKIYRGGGSRSRIRRLKASDPCQLDNRAKTWYGYEESNPNLNVRSVLSYPLNDTRKNWLAAQASNLEPPRSERGAPPIAPAASGRG